MLDAVLFIALPYVAILSCIFGSFHRIKTDSVSYSSLSSQFLESKSLVWGSVPWHIGIITILALHLAAFLFPGPWQRLMAIPGMLYAVEAIGLALAIGCAAGLVVLAVRRLTSSKIQTVTTPMDLLVLGLLFVQVLLGIGIAVAHRWGAAWAAGTLVEYLWSLLVLQPDINLIADMPFMVRAHVVLAFVLILIIPFSRLIHMFAVPIGYLFRPPQVAVWSNPKLEESAGARYIQQEARRDFIVGVGGIVAGSAVLGVGALEKIFNFFFGPRLSRKEESKIMELKVRRLQATVEQRKLELERQVEKFIFVAPLSDLSEDRGKYLIDFQMSPAIAFRDKSGLPIVISAKCTHLGCTVGADVKDGKILCPCHVSYFDVQTGQPNPGAPAKLPLPFLPWALMTEQGKLVASRTTDGKIEGQLDPESLKSTRLYIVKT